MEENNRGLPLPPIAAEKEVGPDVEDSADIVADLGDFEAKPQDPSAPQDRFPAPLPPIGLDAHRIKPKRADFGAQPGAVAKDDFEPEVPVVKRGQGIMVKALRPGFFQGSRYVIGDEFEVAGPHRLGSWMLCLDPKHEVAHQKAMKEEAFKLRKKQKAEEAE